MPNYALDALRGYEGVNSIYRQNKLDAQESELYNRARTKEDALIEANRLRGASLLESVSGEQQPGVTAPIAANGLRGETGSASIPAEQQAGDRELVAQSFYKHMTDKWGFTPEQSAKAMGKAQPLINNPDQAAEAMSLGDNIESALRSGKLPDQKELTRYANILGATELANRNGDDGLDRKINGTYVAPSGRGIMFDLGITDKASGRKYSAPATVGKGTDEKDTVQEFPIKDVLAWFGGSRETLKALVEAEAMAGLSTTADKYQAYVERQQGRGEHIQDAVASKRAMSGEDDYATDGKSIVTLNDFKKLSAEQQAKFIPLKQQEINMKREQLDIARTAAGKPSDLERKIAQIGIMVKNNELTPEEAKAARLHIYGAIPGTSDTAQIGLLMKQEAIERDKQNTINTIEQKRAAIIDKDGGVTEQNIAEINVLTKILGEPPFVAVTTPGEKHFIGPDGAPTVIYKQETKVGSGNGEQQGPEDQGASEGKAKQGEEKKAQGTVPPVNERVAGKTTTTINGQDLVWNGKGWVVSK